MDSLISRQVAIDAISSMFAPTPTQKDMVEDCLEIIENLPSAQPEPFADADKLKRCRFEYINACKTVTYPTPDTSKGDIHDAYAVIKALHPIFGEEEF